LSARGIALAGLAASLLSGARGPALAQTGLPSGCPPPPLLEVVRLAPDAAPQAPGPLPAEGAGGAPSLRFEVVAGAAGSWRFTGLPSFSAWQQQLERRTPAAGSAWLGRYRAELSYRADVDLSQARYLMAQLVEMRPGQSAAFAEIRRLDNAAHVAAEADENWAVYELLAGAPAATFLVLTPMRSLAYEDDVPRLFLAKIRAALGDTGRARMQELHSLAVARAETTFLRLRPGASRPPAAWRSRDPAFWGR